MTNNKSTCVPLAALFLALAGCGGGSGSSGGTTPAAPVPSAQGAYSGNYSNGSQHFTVVLENDQFYTLYGNTTGGVFALAGFVQGNGSSSNGSFTASDVRDATAAGQLLSGSLSATYIAGTSFNGTLTEGANTIAFSGTPLASSVYNYNAAANLADIAGVWNLTSLRGFANTFTIAATGSFTAVSGGCSFSGSVTPRSSGKNAFDVAVTYGPAPCLLPGQSLSGLAVDYPVSAGSRQLVIALLNQARTSSSAFVGVR